MPVSRLLAALRCWRQLQRERQQLLAMNDVELRDIRLSRIDADRQASSRACARLLLSAADAPQQAARRFQASNGLTSTRAFRDRLATA